jgi:hypothetical protein
MTDLTQFEYIFSGWAFLLQLSIIAHFAIRKRLFESYTVKYGWIIYALCFPALVISLVQFLGGASWSFWLGGFLFTIFAAFGYWIDYVKGISWRKPLRKDIMFPYVTLYLGSIMFYWWPLALIYRPLWFVFGALFIIGTILNITSH